MGWSTWCTDDLCGLIDVCTDAEIRSVADSIVSQGLDKLGYEYLLMDDCWSNTTRAANGSLVPDPAQFPYGMRAVADYVHSKGLRLGAYTCVGTKTCRRGRPGSYGRFDEDARTLLLEWDLDMIKADNCNRPANTAERDLYANFSRAINATGKPALFALCEWGDAGVESWGGDVGQMWRVQQDHLPFYDLPLFHAAGKGYGQGTAQIINYFATLNLTTAEVGPFSWPDPDFLMTLFPVTMDYLSSRTEYTFWTLWNAPLLVATDLRRATAEKLALVANPEVIDINQAEFEPARHVRNFTAGGQLWTKPLAGGDVAVVLWNEGLAGGGNLTLHVSWEDLGWPAGSSASVRDLWARADAGTHAGGLDATLAPRDVFFFRAARV